MNAFNPNEHLIDIKNRNAVSSYLPVAWRLVWFREQCPDGQIETEMLHLDLDRETEEEGYAWNNETRKSEKITKRANGLAVFRATVKDGKGGIATGTKSEKAASFDDFIEKAETGSIGRALAALGYGTQFAPDMEEGQRIVDSPIEPKPALVVDTKEIEQRFSQVKVLFQTLYKPEKWDAFKVRHLGLPVADDGLSLAELDKLYVALVDAKEQAKQKKAS